MILPATALLLGEDNGAVFEAPEAKRLAVSLKDVNMREFRRWLLRVNHPDEQTRRAGRNVIILALNMSCVALLFFPIQIFDNQINNTLILAINVAIATYIVTIFLARKGWVNTAATLFISLLTVSITIPTVVSGSLSIAPSFLILPILISSLCLKPWHTWLVLVGELIALAIMVVAMPENPLRSPLGYQIVFGHVLLLFTGALLSFMGSTSTRNALRNLEAARAQIEATAHELNQSNANLETLVGQRTTELASALRSMEQHAAEQTQLLREVEQQRNAIRELSMPVIPISKSTLVVPLVGVLDTTRLAQLQEEALSALQRSAARKLILDITGVPLVDTMVAQGLISVVQAAGLLGADVTLVGVRPEVAQAIVGLGIQLTTMHTAMDLQSALS